MAGFASAMRSGLAEPRYTVTGFDPVSVQIRRLYLMNLDTGSQTRLTVPDDA